MQWDMTKPCSDCPFLKEGGIPLTSARIKEIADMMLDGQGGMFPCHKTTTKEEQAQRGDHFIARDHHKHCAGALIFAEKNQTATQMMRICERLGMYDASKLMSDPAVVDSVWDSRAQWLKKGLRSRKKVAV
jgi:hypothetical protein